MFSLTGCYTLLYQSNDEEIVYSEPVYVPIPVLVPIPYPEPIFLPAPLPPSSPNDSPEIKLRQNDDSGNRDSDSYTNRDQLRNQGGRGTEERNRQGR